MLGIDPKTIRNRRKKSPKIDEAVKESRHKLLDKAEQKLFDKLESGNEWAISKVLDNLGRERGYGQKSADVNFNLSPADIAKLSDEELETAIARIDAALTRT